MQQYEQNQVWTALEPDIAAETAVLLSRPPQPLLEHPPNRTTFYVLLRAVLNEDKFASNFSICPKS